MSSLSQMMMMMMIVQTSSISKDYGVELSAKIKYLFTVTQTT